MAVESDTLDILLSIKEDIASIKEKLNSYNEKQDDTEREIATLKEKFSAFEKRILDLELQKTRENDSKWKKLIALFAAGCTGIILSNFSDIFKFLVQLFIK